MPRYDQRIVPFRWSIDNLSPGLHTLAIVAGGRSWAESKGEQIRISGAKVYAGRKF